MTTGTSLRAFIHRGGEQLETTDTAAISEALKTDGSLVWLDLGDDLSTQVGELLTGVFGVHPLVVEDMMADYVVPKLEEQRDYLYVLAHSVDVGQSIGELQLAEVDLLLSHRWVITHHHGQQSIASVWRDCQKNPRTLEKGVAWVAHAVLDRMVDGYEPALDRVSEELDSIEESIIAQESPGEVGTRIFELKRALMKLRRVSTAQREVLSKLGRGSPFIAEAALPFFRDVYDHMGAVVVLGENYRELSSGVLEMHLAMQSNRMNEIMKTLAMISTALLPMSLIAGIYGMNFERMPELKWDFGYPMALSAMLMVGVGVGIYFKRKRWL